MNAFILPVRLLLGASFVLTASRALTLPFLAIYLARHFALQPVEVGYMLAASLSLAALAGVYGGYLVDRANRLRLMGVGVLAAAAAAAAFPLLHDVRAAVFALSLANSALALVDIAIKSAFAQLLDEQARLKAFSARYLVNNIAYAVGPMAGTVLALAGETTLFLSAAAVCLLGSLPLLALRVLGPRLDNGAPRATLGFGQTLAVLRGDRRLLYFTLAGAACAFVYGRFSAYLGQYLTVVTDAATAYQTVGFVITVNALVVMGLQYLVGTRIQRSTLLLWQAIGSLLFVCGLLGFMVSTSLTVWVVAMVFFTLGEIVVVPASYLFIDHIAPDSMKGSYYGVQNLAALGSAFSPFICGALLETGVPASMFWVLVASTVVSLLLYIGGQRAGGPQPAAQVRRSSK